MLTRLLKLVKNSQKRANVIKVWPLRSGGPQGSKSGKFRSIFLCSQGTKLGWLGLAWVGSCRVGLGRVRSSRPQVDKLRVQPKILLNEPEPSGLCRALRVQNQIGLNFYD